MAEGPDREFVDEVVGKVVAEMPMLRRTHGKMVCPPSRPCISGVPAPQYTPLVSIWLLVRRTDGYLCATPPGILVVSRPPRCPCYGPPQFPKHMSPTPTPTPYLK